MDLRQWRQAHDYTMARASEILGISQPAISRIERGKYLPSSATLTRLHERSGGEIDAPDITRAWQEARAAQ